MDPSTPSTLQREIRYMPTTAAYDLWAEVYDTDGNFLQALDSIEMKTLLPDFLARLRPQAPEPKIVDLGCGTGRNTVALLQVPDATVVGLDASPKMLEVARGRFTSAKNASFAVYDLLNDESPEMAAGADGIVSTLVLEHVSIEPYFEAVSNMLKLDGLFLLTNMHSEMGLISQAGFSDPKTGDKIRPTSYPHTIEDVVMEARSQGFELVGDVLKRTVDEQLSDRLGPRGKKWIGVVVWFGMIFRKKT